MVLQPVVGSQAVYVLVLLAAAVSAMIGDEMHSSPGATSGSADRSISGTQGDQGGQFRNVYYPAEKQSYTYSVDRSSQYDSGNANVGYSSYQGAHGVPQYVSSFGGFTKMAVAKPYTYYVAQPGEAYQGGRSVPSEQPEDDAQNVNLNANQGFNPTDGKRSLLEVISHQGTLPAHTSLFPAPDSLNLFNNARVQISSTGGYPSNSPRFTYLTFIIPGDLCTLTQQGSGLIGTSQDGFPLENQVSGFVNHRVTSFNIPSFNSPAGPATGYSTSEQYQYPGQSQVTYGSPPAGQAYVNGEFVASGAGTYGNPLQRMAALRSLDVHETKADDRKPPANSPVPATGDAKPNEASDFATGSRSIST